MKKITQIILLIFLLKTVSAQTGNVGIGGTPDASAKLDITTVDDGVAAKKGLLIPRVNLTATNVAAPVVAPANSLLVYNENTAGTYPNNVTPGFYYWSVDKWVKFLAGSNNGLDIGYIVGWASNATPPDYLLPLNGGTYNWADYPDFQSFHGGGYPNQFIASSNATTFTLVDINGNGRFLRGSTTAGTNQDDATALPTTSFTTGTNGSHNHSVDPPNVTTSTNGNHTHTLKHSGELDENQGYPAGGNFNAVWSTDRNGGTPSNGPVNSAGDHTHTFDIAPFNSASNGDHSHTVTGGGDAETRPINTSVIWCLKVKPTSTSANISITNTANTAINGLSVYGSAIGLGGNLNQTTTISQLNNAFTVNNNGTSNTVFNLSSTGDLDVQDNGVSAFFVKDNGNVGINNNNPTAKLHVMVPADNNNNPDGNGVYVYNAGNAGDNDDAIIAARVLGANAGDPFLSLDIDGVTGWSIGIDNSDADKLKFANAWNDPATNTRMSITTGGVVNIANLAGTGTRPVHANSSGDLVIRTSDVATYVLRTSVSMDNANSGYRVAGGATGNLYVESGDIVTITITNKFWWNGGSGGDHELYGLRITGACGTINDYEGFKNGISDDVPRNQEQSLSHQFVWSATCTGNVQFSLLCDNNSQADDASFLGDIVVIATRH